MKSAIHIKWILLINFFFYWGVSNAQNITGTVLDKGSREHLSGAIIMLMDSTGKVMKYTTSDSDGHFSIPIVKGDEGYQIDVNFMGYTVQTIKAPFANSYDIFLEPSTINLNELVVQADKVKVRGDTIEYSVPTLVSTDDRNLGDVLKKLPGVDVSKDGRVNYQGKEIGKLYIEGNDLLGSKYNIATQNIDPRDLVSINIYENHQHIRALEGVVESDVTSINIKFKDSAKGKWVAALQAEVGGSTQKPHIPYSGSTYAMFIGKKYQGINTAKTDAAGNNIIYESNPNVFIIGVDEIEFLNKYMLTDYTSITHTYPPIDKDRTRFNTAYSVTSNHTIPIKNNTILGVGGKFEHNTLNSGNSIGQTYIGNNGEKIEFIDLNNVASQSYYASGDASIELNSKKLYIKDKFRFDIKGNLVESNITGTENRMQKADDRDMNIFNYFSFKKSKGIWVSDFHLFTQFTNNREIMGIISPEEKDTINQNIDTKIFYNLISFNNNIQIAKKIKLRFITSIPYLYRTFKTLTTGASLSNLDFTEKMHNNVMLQYIKPQEQIYMEYNTSRLKIDIGADMWYKYINYKINEKTQDHKYAINPSASIKYDFGPRLTAKLRGSFSMSDIDEQQIYDGLILLNYKYMSMGRSELIQNPSYSVSANIDFRDPISGYFFVANASYSASKSFLYTRFFIDDYIINQQSNEVIDYNSIRANGTLSKAFLDISGKIDASVGFSKISSSINQNGLITPYQSYSYTAEIKFVGDLTKWMNFDYKGYYIFSRYNTSTIDKEEDNHGFNQRIKLSFFPHKSIMIDVTAEHYLDKYAAENPIQMCLLDASFYYFFNQKFQIFIHAKNLLDTKTYSYTSLSPLNITKYSFNLRPLNILIGLEIKF